MPSKKMGRPTENPKGDRITVRLDQESSKTLNTFCSQKNIDRAEAVRIGIKKLESEIKK